MSNIQGNNGGRFYSSLVKPILMDASFVVDASNANGLGVSSVKGANIKNVFMHTSQTPGKGVGGMLNPNPAVGYALIQLKNNYKTYIGGFNSVRPPVSGSNIAINSTAMTIGVPYQITAVGHGTLGTATVAPVADVSGSLASTWFRLYDNYGNTFVIWFSVSGVGAAPVGVGGTLVQQTIASGATAAQIGTALVTTIAGLPSGIAGVNSFTASGTTTVTATSTQTNPYAPLPLPSDGTIATGFTFGRTVTKSNANNWQNVGLPAGVLPAVNASFVATATGDSSGGGSTGTVKVLGVSGIFSVEVLGDPNLSLSPIPIGGTGHAGGFVLVQFLAPTLSTGAYVSPMVATAPTDQSIVDLAMYMDVSSTIIAGE